jgi:hypothetical protein
MCLSYVRSFDPLLVLVRIFIRILTGEGSVAIAEYDFAAVHLQVACSSDVKP